MAQYEDLSIDQGTDVAIEIHLVNVDGSKKNLQGYSVAAQIRQTVATPDSDAIDFTALVVDPADNGVISLVLTNQQTMGLTARNYMYDVEISHQDSDANTYIERVLYGKIVVNPNITRV